MTDYLQQSAAAEKLAREIIAASNIINIWEAAGARVNIVGSLKIGVLAKHRDFESFLRWRQKQNFSGIIPW